MNIKILTLFGLLLIFPFKSFALSESEFLVQYKAIGYERDAEKRLSLIKEQLDNFNEEQRFTILTIASKTAFDVQDYSSAKKYAEELLKLSEKFQGTWNYGNAIHDGNMVLGRLALVNKDKNLAKDYLLKSGGTPGSPQLNSFGPDMSLANDLLNHDIKAPVIEYLEMCKKFWEMDDGRLDSWSASIRGGGRPYFGSNLRN